MNVSALAVGQTPTSRRAAYRATNLPPKGEHQPAQPAVQSTRVEVLTKSIDRASADAPILGTLDRDAALIEINIVTDFIESGTADATSFRPGNGDATTTSAKKYLLWLQLHVATFDVDGTYMRSSGRKWLA